jgi:acyl-CoA thioesterase
VPTETPDFTRDTAVAALGDGRYAGTCSPAWGVPAGGPNGGYLAAMVLRAMLAEVDDSARAARSLTLHYLRAPKNTGVQIQVAVERSGRTLSTVTARLEQDGVLCVIAIGAFGGAFPSPVEFATPAPIVRPVSELRVTPVDSSFPPIAQRLELWGAIGRPPFSGADEADTGGWLRLRDPAPVVDAPLLALLVDAWLPAVFPVLTAPAFAPTIDLTIHFRSPAAAAVHPPTEPLLARYTSTTSRDGYFEEDASVWTPDGTLLAQSRQLALLRPLAVAR